MSLKQLLGKIPPAQFVSEHLHRLPFCMTGTATELCSLGSWDTLGQILIQPDVDLMVVREGQRSGVPDPKNLEEAQRLSSEGHTILVRNAQRHDPQLLQLAHGFAQDLHAPINIHFYVTPPGTHGFSWHYDSEDVFIVQTAGAKQYSLRKNTVNPWPLEETMPQDLRYERELMPLMQVQLKAGDWLYIPCGYWHKADAMEGDESAISLAIGATSRSALDAFDLLRRELTDSLLWRQRMPVTGAAGALSPEELDARHSEIFAQLADNLSEILRSEFFLQRYQEWAGEDLLESPD